jgi:hypothetical protein
MPICSVCLTLWDLNLICLYILYNLRPLEFFSSFLLVLGSLLASAVYLLACLPDDYVDFGYSIFRNGIFYAIRDNGMFCSGIRDYYAYGHMFKYVFAWGWAFVFPFSPLMDNTDYGRGGDVWHTNS